MVYCRKFVPPTVAQPINGKVLALVSTAKITMNSIVAAVPGQVSANLDDETVILELTSGTYYGLNQTGTMIWRLLQEPIQIRTICEAVMEEYEVDLDECGKAVISLLQQLAKHNLVDIQYAQDEKFSAFSQFRPNPIG